MRYFTKPRGIKKKKEPWYKDGLRYECTRCGQCCTGRGYIWVDYQEILGMAEHLNLEPETFLYLYVRRVKSRRSLVQTPQGNCVFLSYDSAGQSQCKVFPARPAQCWTWPFWPANLFDERCWDQAAINCPGVGKGPLYNLTEIRQMRTASPTRRRRPQRRR
ncbi:MAG: YkgJ family cysteine cluster protein [Phycisphaerae bacterium]|nr:YkgJ family cysteine cluster protein [Phycisphaerae bacterium]